MFRKLYNLARFEAHLVPDGPLLIVQGGVSLDPTGADLAFVRSRREGEETVYLPGSSLKGVLRSHAERLLVTALGETAAEDPFNFKAAQRSEANAHRVNGDRPAVYRASCLADRLFGSIEIAGRCRFDDAYPVDGHRTETNRTQIRFGVAIDRAKQSVKVGPWEQEVVTGGRFLLRGNLENYELWMLGLLLQTLSDLGAGYVQIGHGKSRGFGTVQVKEPALRLLYPGRRPAEIEGAGARETDAARRESYGLSADDRLAVPDAATEDTEGLFQGWTVGGWEAIGQLRDNLLGAPWQELAEKEQRRQSERAESEGGHGA